MLEIIRLGLIPYAHAHERQLQLVAELHRGEREKDACLIMEHQSVFTIGRYGAPENVTVSGEFLENLGLDVLRVERGGEVTYHGPGQIVCYLVMNLRRKQLGVAEYVHKLEQIMLNVAERFYVDANRDSRNHGIWVGGRKLGSVGIAVRHGISYHGMALNVNVDLNPFSWINPCGLKGLTMGSMAEELQNPLEMAAVEAVMIEEVNRAFGEEGNHVVSVPCNRKGKPKWLKKRLPSGPGYEKTRQKLSCVGIHTVCQAARCPNQFECFGRGTATFMLMGENCTRNCGFCSVGHGPLSPLDPGEPEKIASAVKDLGLNYTVLTSVTRDDLDDGGAKHFSETISAIRKQNPEMMMEVLIPDLQGNAAALAGICEQAPSVLNHNVETVAGLYTTVRPQAVYSRSLSLLRRVKSRYPHIVTKSGLMLGLGETREELQQTIADIRDTGCDLLTLGQYLQPTSGNLAVQRYVHPDEFEAIRWLALDLGFSGVTAGPHVRSSYRAEELYRMAL